MINSIDHIVKISIKMGLPKSVTNISFCWSKFIKLKKKKSANDLLEQYRVQYKSLLVFRVYTNILANATRSWINATNSMTIIIAWFADTQGKKNRSPNCSSHEREMQREIFFQKYWTMKCNLPDAFPLRFLNYIAYRLWNVLGIQYVWKSSYDLLETIQGSIQEHLGL